MILALLALAACGDRGEESVLDRVSSGTIQSPDEFAVLPAKPLILPDDLAALPPPTPGQTNRADLTPIQDLEVALTGRTGRGVASGADAAMLRTATRGGITPGIRQVLAEEDVVWRDTHKGLVLERLLLRNSERVTYRQMILDAEAELRRLRALGIQVPQLPEQ